jgi:hypothetical protein
VLANLESGRRPYVSVDEVLLLALVLAEPPFALFVPYRNEPPLQVGRHVVEPWHVWRWAALGEPTDLRLKRDPAFGRVASRLADGFPNIETDDPLDALETLIDTADDFAATIKHIWYNLKKKGDE